MALEISNLIAEYKALALELEKSISFSPSDERSAIGPLDKALSDTYDRILKTTLRSDAELRERISFVKEQILLRSECGFSISRELNVLCSDFENAVQLNNKNGSFRRNNVI